jgi:hypothetical protein
VTGSRFVIVFGAFGGFLAGVALGFAGVLVVFGFAIFQTQKAARWPLILPE